jgi:hypothetical protein
MHENQPSSSATNPDRQEATVEAVKEREEKADSKSTSEEENPHSRSTDQSLPTEDHITNLLHFLQTWPCGPWKLETRREIATALLEAMQSYTRGYQKGQPHVDHTDLASSLQYVALVTHAEELINTSPYPARWKFVEFHTMTTENHSGTARMGTQQVTTEKVDSRTPVILLLRPAMHAIQERTEMFQLLASGEECPYLLGPRNDQAPSQAAHDPRKKAKTQGENVDKTKGDEE